MKTSILVVEDDLALNQMLVMALRKTGYDMSSARSWAEARQQLELHAPDVVLLDMNLPDAEGFGHLSEIAAERPTIMLTAFGTIDHAVQAMRMGAADYLVKPASLDELEIVIQRAVDAGRLHAGRAVDQAASSVHRTPDLLGESPAMKSLNQLINAVGGSASTVLVTGESGTGKELISRAIHRLSPRATAPFVRVNCAAIPRELIESELFGHERGAFTGASTDQQGLVAAADEGTLFLDEVAELDLAVQAKLLRVLEAREVVPLGAVKPERVDLRLCSATSADLRARVAAGKMRDDLYYRIATPTVLLPPLRARREEIPWLVERAVREVDPGGGLARAAAEQAEQAQGVDVDLLDGEQREQAVGGERGEPGDRLALVVAGERGARLDAGVVDRVERELDRSQHADVVGQLRDQAGEDAGQDHADHRVAVLPAGLRAHEVALGDLDEQLAPQLAQLPAPRAPRGHHHHAPHRLALLVLRAREPVGHGEGKAAVLARGRRQRLGAEGAYVKRPLRDATGGKGGKGMVVVAQRREGPSLQTNGVAERRRPPVGHLCIFGTC